MKISKPTINEQYAAKWNLRNAKANKHGRSIKPMTKQIPEPLLKDAILAVRDLITEYNDVIIHVQTDEEANGYSARVFMLSKLQEKLMDL